jgi:calcium-independent phospholipase A2
VLVAAVYKKMAPPQLHFFNNCFNDEFSKQPVWKVARYTTAAPMFFKECDDYVDGGVLANNPSETGLTAIQTFHHSQGSHLPIALVVSIGSGIYPAEALGKIDVQDFLFFGKQWLNFKDTVRKRAKNLIQLLSNALVESETVAENTKARCEGQGIPYYRFSPKLAETVATGETDNGVLINMIISTIVQTVPGMEDLHEQFVRISEANQKEKYRKRIARTTTKVTSV